MKGRLTLQQRLILPIVLLGLIAMLSNILAVFSINNVHANAGTIVDQYMVSEERLEDIRIFGSNKGWLDGFPCGSAKAPARPL